MTLSSKSPSAVQKAVFLLDVPPANSQWQGPGSKTVVILPMFLMSRQSVAVIFILSCHFIQFTVVHTKRGDPSFFVANIIGDAQGLLDG